MNFSASDQIQIGISILTMLSIAVALIANHNQIRMFKKQLQVSIFSEYTKRFYEIALKMPYGITGRNFNIHLLPQDQKDILFKYMRAYFNLCSEEFYLNQNNFIDPAVWQVWQRGIDISFSSEAFREAWHIVKTESVYPADFKEWVDKKMNNLKFE